MKTKLALTVGLIAATGGCSLFQAQPAPQITPVERVSDSASSERAEALLESGKAQRAVAAYKSILAAEPDNSEARYGLAEALRRGGDAEASKAEYLKVAENPEWRPKALEGLGQANLLTGDHNGAYEALSTAVAEDVGAWRAWLGLAQLRDLARDWAKADEAYGAALAVSDEPAIVWNNQGVSMLARGAAEEASDMFRKALEVDPAFERAATNLELANAAAAGASLTDLAAAEPDAKKRAQKLNNYGYVAMLQGRYEEAQSLFQAAIEAHPAFYALAFENLKTLKAMQTEQAEE